MFKIGSYVTRKKYNNDIVFKIEKIEDDIVILKGVYLRLYADAKYDDLQLVAINKKKESREEVIIRKLDMNNYFYIPGSILHLDSDKDYLEKCLNYYKKQKIKCYGYILDEKDYVYKIENLMEKHNPKIIVITGHDSYNKKNNKYRNSFYFINAVKKAREKSKDIIIISGACQSDFENLIKNGSNYSSSPKHINIHALDPAIIASYVALTSMHEIIKLDDILDKTTYGRDGIGGIETTGTMVIGMPRKELN